MPEHIPDVEMTALFNLPPDRIIEYLKDRGYMITQDWQAMLERSRERAFTIIGVMKDDIVADAQKIVDTAIQEGKTFAAIKTEFKAAMQAKGWEASTYRLKTIYRVNMDVAYSVGRYQEQMAVADFAPYWQYIAIMDLNTRPAHAEMHGKVFKADDPIWDYWYPPNGFNCRCTVRSYTEKKLERKGLKVESSKGKLKETMVEVQGKRIKTHSYNGVKIDPGWDYNPGKDFMRSKK